MATIVFGVGYIGSALVQDLLFQGRSVVGVDNFFSSDRRAIDGFARSPTFRFVEGSITNNVVVDSVLDLAGPAVDTVFILAAQASGHPDAASAEYTEDANLRGPRVILDTVRLRLPEATIVYASSMRIYGAPLPDVVNESTSVGIFADLSHLSKVYAEKLLEMYAVASGMSCRSVRLGLTFGVAPVFKTDPRFMTAPNLFCAQAASGIPLRVRSTENVALIHVADAVDALQLAGSQRADGRFAAYNAVSELASVTEIAEMVRQIAAEREVSVEVSIEDSVPTSRQRVGKPVIMSELTRLGFEPQRSLRDGLTETIDHFLVRGQ